MSSAANKRLGFIDATRSIAIIMMLQGHFIASTFKDYFPMEAQLKTTWASGSRIFDIWLIARGFTAPLFFTITGLVFVYLLGRNQDEPFFKQKRVRKGIKRGLLVIAWGYFLQLNVKSLHVYMDGRLNSRFFLFHVLQSIGFGILALIIIYGLFKIIKKLRFSIILLIAALLVFGFAPAISGSESYVPKGAHEIIQNMFKGPNSGFPLFPWLGYVLFGGAIGSFIRESGDRIHGKWFPLKLLGLVFFISLVGRIALLAIYGKLDAPFGWHNDLDSFDRLILVVLLIVGLMYFERKFGIRDSLFIRMGQNTLVIYIVHVILLYGAVIGIGVKTFWYHELSGWQSALGAIVFIGFFALMTWVQNRVKLRIRN